MERKHAFGLCHFEILDENFSLFADEKAVPFDFLYLLWDIYLVGLSLFDVLAKIASIDFMNFWMKQLFAILE